MARPHERFISAPRCPLLLRLLVLLLAAPTVAQEAVPAETSDPASLELAAEAVTLLQAGDLGGGIKKLEELRESDQATDMALGILGGAYAQRGDFDEAVAVLAPLAALETADPAVLYNAGRAAFQLGDFDRAQAWLERSFRLEPSSPARRELGVVMSRLGRDPEVLSLLLPWVRANPNDLPARVAGAIAAVNLERVAEAEQLLAGLPPGRAPTSLLRGRLAILKGDPRLAISLLRPLLETGPEPLQHDIRRNLANAHLEVGEAAAAVEALQGLDASDAGIALQLSQAYYQDGQNQKAISTLRPFAERILADSAASGPRHLLLEYGRFLISDQRAAEALPFLERSAELNPKDPQAFQAYGQALAAAGRRDEAREALARYQELVSQEQRRPSRESQLSDPTGAQLQQATAAFFAGDSERALGIVRMEATVSPEDLRPPLLEAHLLMLTGSGEESLAKVDEVLERFGPAADAYYQRGATLMGLERLDEAEQSLRQALQLSPEHVAAMSDLAVLLTSRGGREEAATLLERALALQPENERIRQNLDKLRGTKIPGG